jgi:hypothetical protein
MSCMSVQHCSMARAVVLFCRRNWISNKINSSCVRFNKSPADISKFCILLLEGLFFVGVGVGGCVCVVSGQNKKRKNEEKNTKSTKMIKQTHEKKTHGKLKHRQSKATPFYHHRQGPTYPHQERILLF